MGGGTGTGLPKGMSAEEYFRLTSTARRIISPGIEVPSSLESNIIYVTFIGNYKIDAIIESTEKFYFRSKNNDAVNRKKFKLPKFNPDHYDILLEELVGRNDGVVDYHRARINILEPIFKAFIRDLEAGKVIKF